MGISIAICETECENALCRPLKENVLMVLVKDAEKYGDAAEYEIFMAKDDVEKVFPDWEGFAERNKVNENVCDIYLNHLKDPSDRAALEKIMRRSYTGWVDLSKLNADDAKKLITGSPPENRQTEWDMLSFDEMGDMCAMCKLSWDKGKGCVGSFGPDNSALPAIAEKYGCTVTASIPEGVRSNRAYTKDDALKLSKEVSVLRNALEKEGKLAVRRYSGAVDRLDAVAKISAVEGCRFWFF